MFMKNKTIFAFIAGAALGSAASYLFLRTKFDKIAQEEIDSVKAMYARKTDKILETPIVEPEGDLPETKDNNEETPVQNYISKVKEQGYIKYSDITKEEKGGSDVAENKPYVISPDEFGELDDYDTETLYYYADDVLTDDQDNIIENVDKLVGVDSLTHFGEYEDDSVFVRNDTDRTDYEILLDVRRYSDAMKNAPHQADN